MKTNQIRAEVSNLKGEKVLISKDFNKMNLSKLGNDVYLVSYTDNNGNVLWTECFVKGRKVPFV